MGAALLANTCAVPGCQNAMRERFVFCVEHWEMCPEPLTDEMIAAWNAGNRFRFIAAKGAAIGALNRLLATRDAVATG